VRLCAPVAQDLCVIVSAEDATLSALVIDYRNRPLKHIQRCAEPPRLCLSRREVSRKAKIIFGYPISALSLTVALLRVPLRPFAVAGRRLAWIIAGWVIAE
jgi:hypothetical protein